MMRIDGLQYAKWSEKIFRQMRTGGLSAVHVTVAYHEGFRETVTNLEDWNRRFEQFPELICKGQRATDIDRAHETGRTAIFFGAQNASPIESDIGLIEILHTLGLRFMQLTYNNQSLLASGCYEADDSGITRMGRQAIKEMNRVGLVIDMSHSGPRSTIEAADLSQRPIAVSHANPHEWSPSLRNKGDDVIRAVTGNGGMMGFSIYPHHLRDGSSCTLGSFCGMIARAVERYGIEHFESAPTFVRISLTALSRGCVLAVGRAMPISERGRRQVFHQCRSGSATIEISRMSNPASGRSV